MACACYQTVRSVINYIFLAVMIIPGISFSQDDTEYRNYAPTFSPDGKSITWYAKIEGNWDIFSLDLNSKEPNRITKAEYYEGEPSWSPDKQRLVLTSDRDGNEQIYLIFLLSGHMEKITEGENPRNSPVFSPDGEHIYFKEKEGKNWYLHKMNIHSRENERISDIALEGRFRISTKGESISFIVKEQKKYPIIRMTLDGYLLSKTLVPFRYPGNPHYSDQLDLIVFDAHSAGEKESGDGEWELWTTDTKGKEITRITDNRLDDWGAFWSPDSKRITYAGGGLNNTGYEIYLFELESEKTIQLSSR